MRKQIVFHPDDENYRIFESFRCVNGGHDRCISVIVILGPVVFIHERICFDEIREFRLALMIVRERELELTDVVDEFHDVFESFFRFFAVAVNALHSMEISDLIQKIMRAFVDGFLLFESGAENGKGLDEFL